MEGKRLSGKAEEFDSMILAVSHSLLQGIIFLSMGSIYRLVGLPRERVTLRHAEIFLVSTTVVLASLILLSQFWPSLGWVAVALGNLRILQIVSLNLNTLVFDFSPLSESTTALKKARWHFVALGFSFLDTILIFGFMYQFFDYRWQILNQHFSRFFEYFYYSVLTISTIGYGEIHPVEPLGRFLVMYQAMLGVFFLVFFVSGALSRLNRHL